jgi:hypothetical protein
MLDIYWRRRSTDKDGSGAILANYSKNTTIHCKLGQICQEREPREDGRFAPKIDVIQYTKSLGDPTPHRAI